ncbi:radical SAM protein [Cohnella cellulosilytica]|uniref:Radical SAM protein n=1 Tax=Cohnella cellulosilytica TaxID=986710 RepID=A0ABW2F3Y5_9BACL
MLAFYPGFVRTFDDLPGRVSLLIHSWNGCNMRCFGCHNYDDLIAAKPDASRLTAEQAVERIRASAGLFDALLVSGGEFLVNRASDIVDFLRSVRGAFDGAVIVYTNGTYPGKLRMLLDRGLVDGVHIDMKLPYHLLDPGEDSDVYETIIGTVPSRRTRRDMLAAVEAVIRHNGETSQVRTVRYPQLSDEYFERIRAYVDELNAKHGSRVPYFLNPYYPPQAPRRHSQL